MTLPLKNSIVSQNNSKIDKLKVRNIFICDVIDIFPHFIIKPKSLLLKNTSARNDRKAIVYILICAIFIHGIFRRIIKNSELNKFILHI